MKRLKIIALISMISAGVVSSVFATQGTCSYHGGVDCKAGYDWDGSAICNDGWKDSSEMFYDTKTCTANLHFCNEKTYKELSLKYNIEEQSSYLNNLYTQYNSSKIVSSQNQTEEIRENAIKALRFSAEITPLQSKLEYDLLSLKKDCYLSGEIEYQKIKTEAIQKIINPCQENSLYVNGSCVCKPGYIFSNGSCIDNSLNCMNQYGKSSYYDNGSCQCSSGYQMNYSKTKCVSSSESICQTNATLKEGRCSCDAGTVSDGQNNCVSLSVYCQVILKTTVSNDGLSCICPQGQTYNKLSNTCSTLSSIPKTTNSNQFFSRTLKKGMIGQDVKNLQILLVKLNYLSSNRILTTTFDSSTHGAVVKFQKDNKIQPASGSFGPVSQALLLKLSK